MEYGIKEIRKEVKRARVMRRKSTNLVEVARVMGYVIRKN